MCLNDQEGLAATLVSSSYTYFLTYRKKKVKGRPYIYSARNVLLDLIWDVTNPLCRHNVLVVFNIIMRSNNKQTSLIGLNKPLH